MHSSWLIGGILGIHISLADVSLLVSIQSRGGGEGVGKMSPRKFVSKWRAKCSSKRRIKFDFITVIPFRFLGFGAFKVSIVIEN